MATSITKIRNVCILGHGGDGKTSLTESLLYLTKATDRLGKPADGNTVSDYDPEEIRRKISIQTTVDPVEFGGCKINLLDAPGFFDFVGETVEAMRVSDTGIIVMSAKSGVSVGAQKSWRTLKAEGIPAVLYIGKLDEEHADFYKTYEEARSLFGISVAPVVVPIMENGTAVGIVDLVTKKAYSTAAHKTTEIPLPASMEATVEELRAVLAETVAETDDELMMKFFDGEEFTEEEFINGLRTGVASGKVAPVFCGSAVSGLGSEALLRAIVDYLPSPDQGRDEIDISGGEEKPFKITESGSAVLFIFKTVADQYGRFSFFKVLSGKVTPDMTVSNTVSGATEKLGRIYMVRGKKNTEVSEITAGDIGAVAKLTDTRTNDTLCAAGASAVIKPMSFPRTCYTQAIIAKNKAAEEKIAIGLSRLHDEDPVFENALNAETHQQTISGMGVTHLDVLVSKLKAKFGVEVELVAPRVAYREKIRKVVEAEGRHKKQSGGHGQFGHVKIRFEPCESEGLEFAEEVFGGSVPKNFFPAVEKGLRECMERGVLAGYPVVNLKAVLYDGSYHDVDSNELSFKLAARLAFKDGLPKANPVILEPYGELKVVVPADYMGDINGDLNKRRGRVIGMDPTDDGMQMITAEVPMSEMHSYANDLRSMTRGWGSFTLDFVRYEEAPPMVQASIIEEAKARMQDEDDE
ncbi:MAG: elongation factor G [Clostridiales bacterium]|nr:elongation factor G [Clostridiales bacterium]